MGTLRTISEWPEGHIRMSSASAQVDSNINRDTGRVDNPCHITPHKNPIIEELDREIQRQLSRRLADVNHGQTERLNSHIQKLVTNHLNNGWSDKDFKPEFAPNSKMTLFTGTGGGYLSRTVSHAFQKNGAKVIRATHGRDAVLFNDPLWASTEIPFSDTYVTYGTKAAEITREKVDKHRSIRRLQDVPSVVAGGSLFLSLIHI